MECPKCHNIIPDNSTVCPHCNKVLYLVCPNCHTNNHSSVCSKCGYIILEKCAKCGRMVSTGKEKCKCGFSVKSSIACNNCESDEFASVTINFNALKDIRTLFGSQERYTKFLTKLRNLINSQLKNFDGNIILYNSSYVFNFNRELSFATSSFKALRFAVKILNVFSNLNLRIQHELGCSLKLNIVIQKKDAEELLLNKPIKNNVKVLTKKKNQQMYLKDMQIIIDEYVQDCISKEYKTDTLYNIEQNGKSTMYYELILSKYIVPPTLDEATNYDSEVSETENAEQDNNLSNKTKSLNINTKCHFVQCASNEIPLNIKPDIKILSIRGDRELQYKISDLIKLYEKEGLQAFYISYTEDLNYKPWGFFEKLFKEYFELSSANGLINPNFDEKQFTAVKQFLLGKVSESSSPENNRFKYFEIFNIFLKSLKNKVIIVDGFENIDDTSIQALELYFDKFKKINVKFVFITDTKTAVHSKIKGLLRTKYYTELYLHNNRIASLLSNIKEDASEFIQSEYYEKIKERFNGSKLYFDNALKYLQDKEILVSYDDRLILKTEQQIDLAENYTELIKNRLKLLSKNKEASLILAYSSFLGERLDFSMLCELGIKDIKSNAEILEQTGFTFTKNNIIYINNYNLIRPIIQSTLKNSTEIMLAKKIIAKLGKKLDNTTLITLFGIIGQFKEEYLLLWKNAQLAISTGDYDAYLKNTLGFLSITDKIENNIPPEEIENNKKDVYNNILISLYKYSPAKIYSITDVLLNDAILSDNKERIIKLSNLMLQGALYSSDYKNASYLINKILSETENTALQEDNVINSKMLLLSLVNLEILFNTGEYEKCSNVADEIVKILTPKIIEKIKPISFSTESFTDHIAESLRLAGFAKTFKNLETENFFNSAKTALGKNIPDTECIIAIQDYISGKKYTPSNIEYATAFSKVIFLILQELSNLNENYKPFAQNIHQAKLLAEEIHQTQIEYICDLLIGYAYTKIDVPQKGYAIFNDISEKSKESGIFMTELLSEYFSAKTELDFGNDENAQEIINTVLEKLAQKQAEDTVFYTLFKNLNSNSDEYMPTEVH